MRPTASCSSALSLGAAGLLLSAGLAAQTPFGPTQFVWTAANGGDGAFEARSADLDGDGDLDLVCCNNDVAACLPELVWFENDGAGNFGAPTTIHQWPSTAAGGVGCDVGDFDGDGDVDAILAFGSSSSGPALGWLANDGAGNFDTDSGGICCNQGRVLNYSSGVYGPGNAQAADLDGDGDQDVISSSLLDNKIAWYRNLGGGSFGPQQVISTSVSSAFAVYAADLDGDGDQDVLSASYLDDKVAWYPNLGGGSFGAQRVLSNTADGARGVHAADLDSDGDVDVLSASGLDDRVVVYERSADFCRAYTTADLGFYLAPTVGGSSAFSLGIPNNPSLLGLQLTVQATASSTSPAAFAGIASSNGVRASIAP